MTIAFLGDSITLGYGLENVDCRFATLVSKNLGMTELNYGITGTLVAKAGLNHTDGKDFISRASLIDEADVAVVFGGTNDYFWSDQKIFGNDESYFEYAIRKIIERVKDKRQGKLTLFVTPYPHNGFGNFSGGNHWKDASQHDTDAKNFNGHTLEDYVKVIELLCKENGVHCLNLFKGFPFCWEKHTSDGCHPNEQGHALLADAVTKKLKEILNRSGV